MQLSKIIQIEKNNTELGYEFLYYISMNDRRYYFNPCNDIENEFKEKIKNSKEVLIHPKVTPLQLKFHSKVIRDCKQILNLIKRNKCL